MLTIADAEPITDPDPAEEPERATAVDPDGWVYDCNSGEILGHAHADDRFTIDSEEAADWALELRSRIEGEIAGLDARLKAVTAQLKALRAEKVRRLAWWEWRFGPLLVAFARRVLAGGKSRTARFGWGAVRFRTTPGTHQILDMAEAVAWMRVWAPECVRVVESVAVKDVIKLRRVVARKLGEEPERLAWLAESGAVESVTISTGIEVEVEVNP